MGSHDNWERLSLKCPPGLEPLLAVDHLEIDQEIEIFEAIFGIETNNRYRIFTRERRQIFYVLEDTAFLVRQFAGRPFQLMVTDTSGTEVLHFHKPCVCGGCCCLGSFTQVMEITSPPQRGKILALVKEQWSFYTIKFFIETEEHELLLRIRGHSFDCKIHLTTEYKILTPDMEVIGRITRKWPGLARDYFTDADYYTIDFPLNLNVHMKAAILGAAFLIDFTYYENRDRQ